MFSDNRARCLIVYFKHRVIIVKNISTFFSGDINRDQIEYILKHGVNATSDSFEFKISDKGKDELCILSVNFCVCVFCL